MAAASTESTIKWDSQPLAAWTARYAAGTILSLAGKQTHYVVKGAGKPVIFLHGFFFDSTVWCHNLDRLAQSHRVYALDLWGFGYSARTTQPSYALYSQQLAAFMKALDIEQATLVGRKELHAPRHGGQQRLVALVAAPPAAAQQPEPVIQPVQDLPGRQGPHPRRGQFDGQRNPVQPGTDGRDHRTVRVVQHEPIRRRCGSFGE